MDLSISEIAKQMSSKYKDSEFNWILNLLRLEKEGYQITKKENKPIIKSNLICNRCHQEIKSNMINIYHGEYYCNRCLLLETANWKGETNGI